MNAIKKRPSGPSHRQNEKSGRSVAPVAVTVTFAIPAVRRISRGAALTAVPFDPDVNPVFALPQGAAPSIVTIGLEGQDYADQTHHERWCLGQPSDCKNDGRVNRKPRQKPRIRAIARHAESPSCAVVKQTRGTKRSAEGRNVSCPVSSYRPYDSCVPHVHATANMRFVTEMRQSRSHPEWRVFEGIA